MYDEADYLLLSGLHHFVFCIRRWALVHIEQQWAENEETIEGHLFHERAHDVRFREKRGSVLIVRGISCSSSELGVSGTCDVVELHKSEKTGDCKNGIPISGYEGLWALYPVEYKKGNSMENDADRLQLCGQAMCLEEMLSFMLFWQMTARRQLNLSDLIHMLVFFIVTSRAGHHLLWTLWKNCVRVLLTASY